MIELITWTLFTSEWNKFFGSYHRSVKLISEPPQRKKKLHNEISTSTKRPIDIVIINSVRQRYTQKTFFFPLSNSFFTSIQPANEKKKRNEKFITLDTSPNGIPLNFTWYNLCQFEILFIDSGGIFHIVFDIPICFWMGKSVYAILLVEFFFHHYRKRLKGSSGIFSAVRKIKATTVKWKWKIEFFFITWFSINANFQLYSRFHIQKFSFSLVTHYFRNIVFVVNGVV